MGLAVTKQEEFWEACGFGNTARVKKLIADGIDVNWVSYTHNSCAIHVASQGKKDIVGLLLDAGCNVNAVDDRGNLALHHAAMTGHDDIVDILVNAGSDINCQDKNGWTPLITAAYFCQLKVVKVLLQHNCSVTLQNKDSRTALHEACRSQTTDNEHDLADIVQLLIDAGAELDTKASDALNQADFTPLMFSAYHGHASIAQTLIDAGCDLNASASNGWTALHWAADRGHTSVVRALLNSGINARLRNQRGELADRVRGDNTELRTLLTAANNNTNNTTGVNGPVTRTVNSVSGRVSGGADVSEMLETLSTEITSTAHYHSSLVNQSSSDADNNDDSDTDSGDKSSAADAAVVTSGAGSPAPCDNSSRQ